jgi:triacylglycerol lipase
MKNRIIASLLGLVALTLSASAVAETLVLIQGYLGSAEDWRESGVTDVLSSNGWRDAGHLRLTPAGVRSNRPLARGGKRFYTLSLPTEAPLLAQANILGQYMTTITGQYPGETLILAGHSAGGVLGRLYMVQHPDSGVDALITIASPHLGTESAEIGAQAGRSPLAWLAPLVGGDTLNRSQGLYQDLSRERPGNLLFWLNRQEHPPARYISVVRRDESLLGIGDIIVPEWSQDMNHVYALRGRARSLVVPGEHGLDRRDGELLVRILGELQSAREYHDNDVGYLTALSSHPTNNPA